MNKTLKVLGILLPVTELIAMIAGMVVDSINSANETEELKQEIVQYVDAQIKANQPSGTTQRDL